MDMDVKIIDTFGNNYNDSQINRMIDENRVLLRKGNNEGYYWVTDNSTGKDIAYVKSNKSFGESLQDKDVIIYCRECGKKFLDTEPDFSIMKEHLRNDHAKTYGSGRINATFRIEESYNDEGIYKALFKESHKMAFESECWRCRTDIESGRRYCTFHCPHEGEYDEQKEECVDCGKHFEPYMMAESLISALEYNEDDVYDSILDSTLLDADLDAINKVYHNPLSIQKTEELKRKEQEERERQRTSGSYVRPRFTSDPRYAKGQYEKGSIADTYSRTGRW